MKKKPSVVSKNAKANANVREVPAMFRLEAPASFDGVATTQAAAVTLATGTPIAAGNIIARVATTYRLNHTVRSGVPAGFVVDAINGGSYDAGGMGTAQKQGEPRGGSGTFQGTYIATHVGKKGKVLAATGTGYVVNSTGEFTGGPWTVGTQVAMTLGNNGKTWTIKPKGLL